MKIRSLELQNFRRFTNLRVEGIPDTAKLVLLIGSNGSGKSSLFDAFETLNGLIKNAAHNPDYYSKKDEKGNNSSTTVIRVHLNNNDYVDNNNANTSQNRTRYKQLFYGRTSFRQVAQLTRHSLGESRVNVSDDSDRPRMFIERDMRFENDVENVIQRILSEVFSQKEKSNEDIIAEYIEKINKGLLSVFGSEPYSELRLLALLPPGDGKTAQILFRKGDSQIHYNLLSAGEKEVFNIFLNLVSRGENFNDTIFFYDEIDLHLNTAIQYRFLKELTEHWIPDSCQLWTASHSLGFIEYARDDEDAVIIDLDDLDFDSEQILAPVNKSIHGVYQVAIPQEYIGKLFQGKQIVYVENRDDRFYSSIQLPDVIFLPVPDKHNVFYRCLQIDGTIGLLDRDYLSDEERLSIMQKWQQVRILPYYSIENLLYHPDNLAEYYSSRNKEFDREGYCKAIKDVLDKPTTARISAGIKQARDSYPYFKNVSREGEKKMEQSPTEEITEMLTSDDFETIYKVFPAKEYGRSLPQRQNIRSEDLAKTTWFRRQVKQLLDEENYHS